MTLTFPKYRRDGRAGVMLTSPVFQGVVRVVKELDREAASALTLTVTATDGGQPPLTVRSLHH